MRINQKAVSAGLTINLGNFESLRIDATVTAEIEAGDDPAAVREKMISELRADLESDYRAFAPNNKSAAQLAEAPAKKTSTLFD